MGIHMENVTKHFGGGKGIFDLSFDVKEGEVFGYLGPNGAGKSTTIRHLMGFMKPTSGSAAINGLDCWGDRAQIQKDVGYLPGEMAFMDDLNGRQFLELLAGMRGMKDLSRRDELIERLQFDVKASIRKMSKGMKQKLGIVAAFMHDPDILILDEPTSGLDPLMQSVFIDLVIEEKEKGKTILMSSHSFAEIDRSCDRAGIIKNGRLVAVENVRDLRAVQTKIFEVAVKEEAGMARLRHSGLDVFDVNGLRAKVRVQGDYETFIEKLSRCGVQSLDVHTQNLEDIFMHYYDQKEASAR
ncbi:MAG TPA: ABC transporter ATP-binding protein [Bacillales bacterium]|nr:ABC transporter ATP-binding protein [Bacillales bacterium]